MRDFSNSANMICVKKVPLNFSMKWFTKWLRTLASFAFLINDELIALHLL